MEHYYVISGNEYGVDLSTKKNFLKLELALEHYEATKFDDFGCHLMYVNPNGDEDVIECYMNEEY